MPGGRAVIKGVAERFPQLYLIPGENGAEQAYLDAVLRGISPPENGLLHFQTDERDRLETVFTPTGSVDVLTLHRRQDFELFLRIMAHRCGMAVIPPAQGAATLIGIPEWGKINAHKEAFLREEKEKGNSAPDWGAEFRSFTADKKNYTDTLIVLSEGPYSGINAAKAGVEEECWLQLSHSIRLYHELTHVICRRTWPGKSDAVWDELVADAVGIFAAFGYFDRKREELFLGVNDGEYTGGRLQNYVDDPADEKKLNDLARRVSSVLKVFEKVIAENGAADVFALISILEARQKDLWGVG